MNRGCFVSAWALVFFGAALLGLPPQANGGQADGSARRNPELRRTAEGHPDLQGVWWGSGPEDIVYTSDLETGYPDVSARQIQGREYLTAPATIIVDPPDGLIPYQPWAKAKRENIPHGREGPTIGRTVTGRDPSSLRDLRPQTLCLVGTPRMTLNREFHVLQVPGYVIMLWEWGHGYRVIPLDKRPPVPSVIKLSMGDSRGRWEGDTLIVETTNVNDWDWFDGAGTIHSDAMTLVERYTMRDANTLDYRITITDPNVFTRPWTVAFPLVKERRPPPTAGVEGQPLEHACVEGERSIQNIFKGGDPRRWPNPY
jgi:hypothetical protein